MQLSVRLGDGFSEFTKGRDRTIGAIDIDALEQWLTAVPVRQVPAESREAIAD